MYDRTMQTVKRLGKEEDLLKVGFTNFKLRHTGRFDMQIVSSAKKVIGGFTLSGTPRRSSIRSGASLVHLKICTEGRKEGRKAF